MHCQSLRNLLSPTLAILAARRCLKDSDGGPQRTKQLGCAGQGGYWR